MKVPFPIGPEGVAVTGLGYVVVDPGEACDPRPYLTVKKNRKFMGVQDDLAVIAAARALEAAALGGVALGERSGLYLAAGFIPFERNHIDSLLEGGLDGDHFSMDRFSTVGYAKVHPLLTFRCLPNMPAFHVSLNFDLQGPYLVTYPGAGQLYIAIEAACTALAEGEVDRALVVGVAHQRNFLVEHHYARIEPPVAAADLRDAAGCVVLETHTCAQARRARVLGRMRAAELEYLPFDPEAEGRPHEEWAEGAPSDPPLGAFGAASLPVLLGRHAEHGRMLEHYLSSRDGIRGRSRWEWEESR